jgi:hypothetical protein
VQRKAEAAHTDLKAALCDADEEVHREDKDGQRAEKREPIIEPDKVLVEEA